MASERAASRATCSGAISNYVVPDTAKWEQAAAYYIDTHPLVDAFVKNASLGFATPYLSNGQMHDYMPDFVIRLKTDAPVHLILETKGYDPREEVKSAAAERWVDAVNAQGSYGRWRYTIVKKTTDVPEAISKTAREIEAREPFITGMGRSRTITSGASSRTFSMAVRQSLC